MITIICHADVQCPNAVNFNGVTGYTYIVNNFSNNVSVFRETDFIGNVPTGIWPTAAASDPYSGRTYVTNLQSQVAVLEGTTVIAHIPDYYEPYGVAFNPVNRYAYVTDLDSTVQVIDGTSLLTKFTLPIQKPTQKPDGYGVSSWTH